MERTSRLFPAGPSRFPGGPSRTQWIPVWICFGVGVHFFPLASALNNPTLRPLGLLLAAVAAAALVAGLGSAVPPSTVTGLGAGLCLLGFGLAMLLIRGPRSSAAGDEPVCG